MSSKRKSQNCLSRTKTRRYLLEFQCNFFFLFTADDPLVEARRSKEIAPARAEHPEPKPQPAEPEPKKEPLGKRPAEQSPEAPEPKKPCLGKEPPLDDDLSEISDDADEILDRVEVSH